MSKGVLSQKFKGRRDRGLQERALLVAAREAILGRCVLEMLENRQLLSVTIPLYNGDFETPVWVSSGGTTFVQQTVAPGTQPWNSNDLDPRFGTPGWAKTAEGGGGPGPNSEGLYGARNDLGFNQYYDYVNGQLPAPASGTNFLNIVPAPGATYHIWVDQQPDTASQGSGANIYHGDLHYPAMIPATNAIAGHTYQVTVALGNPLVNGSTGIPASVELDFTIGAGTFNEPSKTNSSTTPPQPGDSWLMYDGFGSSGYVANPVGTVASVTTDSSWNTLAPGTFRDLSLTWTCPAQYSGLPLDVLTIFHCGSSQVSMDNVRLVDLTGAGTAPVAPSGLTATAASSHQINLSWTDNSNNENGFKIDQSTSADFSQNLTTATVGANVTTYSATGLSGNTTYYYRVRATNGVGDSANSNTSSATTQAGPSASLVSIDTTTQGSWVGTTYGTDGYNVFGDSASYPSYATVSASGQSAWTWVSSTSDIRALQKASNHSDRIAAIWYSSSSMDVTINVTGGSRQVALYVLDMDNLGRAETIDAYDAVSGTTLMSQQTISSFSNGKYVVLNLNGNVRLHFTNIAGANVNAVLSGIFFSTPPATTLPSAPSGLNATAVSGSQINLAWTDNSSNESGFRIDQATSSDFSTGLTTVTVGSNATTYNATGLAAGTTYYYRVRATNALGDSANTSTASATTTTTSVIPIPDSSFEQATLGQGTPASPGTLTSPVTGTMPGWNLTINPTTYNGGTYGGWEPYAQVFTGNTSGGDYIASQDGAQHLTFFGGELFSGYPWQSGWPAYGIIPAQTVQLKSTGITATTVAGATYTATIAVANPLWHTVSHMSSAQLAAFNLTAATPTFELDIVANGQVVASHTLASPDAGQWYDLTTTWTATTSGQSIQLQAIASNFSEGQMGPGHTLQTPEGPFPYTTSDASFDNARLTVTVPVGVPSAPSGLTATAASASQINLSWTDNSANETGFKIDQATSSDFSTGLTTVTLGANTTTYNATGLSAGTTYYYRVRATNAVGDSANTSTASATTAAAGTPVAIPVPDGDFTDAAGNYINSNTGGGLTFTSPMTATLSGWAISANPSTANGGYFAAWEPYGVLDSVTSGSGASPYNSNVAWIGNQPASSYHAFIYYPGEQYNNGGVVAGAQPGASFTMTSTGISAAAVAGTTYTATILYANVSWSNTAVNPSANVALNILANGVVVGTGTLAGLAQNSPWTPVTATWTATGAYAGQAIQLQVVATNFLEGPGTTQQWQVPTFGFTHATLTATASSSIPAAPSGLTAAAASSSQVSLNWTDNSIGETGFEVDWATDANFTQNLLSATVGVNITSYAATGLSLNTRYYFRVRALGSGGNSVFSSPVQGMLRLGDANLDGQVDLTDLSILAGNWQMKGKIFADGDFNGDGAVDLTDLSILAGQWQTPAPAPAPVAAAPVAAPVTASAAVVADDAAQPVSAQTDLAATAAVQSEVNSSGHSDSATAPATSNPLPPAAPAQPAVAQTSVSVSALGRPVSGVLKTPTPVASTPNPVTMQPRQQPVPMPGRGVARNGAVFSRQLIVADTAVQSSAASDAPDILLDSRHKDILRKRTRGLKGLFAESHAPG